MPNHPPCGIEGCLPCILNSVRLSKRQRMSEARREFLRASRLLRAAHVNRRARDFAGARAMLRQVRLSLQSVQQHAPTEAAP